MKFTPKAIGTVQAMRDRIVKAEISGALDDEAKVKLSEMKSSFITGIATLLQISGPNGDILSDGDIELAAMGESGFQVHMVFRSYTSTKSDPYIRDSENLLGEWTLHS